ncbi:MAG: glycosyltransferase [Neisseriaceae bacterium]|nr:MAG: glycosyltransferase [Neisseriaceae bacterium]
MIKTSPVCAVVVTYNRRELLVECLEALCRQTTPLDLVYIVDNASTDGTEDFLRENGYLDNSLFRLVTLPSNLGGAGGFYHGIKIAFENGFEQILLMDDDGFPADDCLEQLLVYCKHNLCIGSLVLDKNNPNQLCFPIRLANSSRIINTTEDLQQFGLDGGMIEDVIIPFNGVLLCRKLIELYGYPKPSYFIWGDDMEYIWRLKRQGVKLTTVTRSIFYHPRNREIGVPMFFGRIRFNDTPSKVKLYCMSRNNTANLLQYKGKLAAVVFILKLIWFYTFTQPSREKLEIGLKGVKHGIQKDFSHHQEFLS